MKTRETPPVVDSSGRTLGHVFEARARWGRDTFVLDELHSVAGRAAASAARPRTECRGIPWEAVAEVWPDRIVVNADHA